MRVVREDNMINEFIRNTIDQYSKRDLDSQINCALESVLNISNADCGVLYLLDQSKEYLLPQSTIIRHDDEGLYKFKNISLYIAGKRNNEKPSVYCMFTGENLHIKDIYSYTGFDVREYLQYDEFYQQHSKSMSVLPLTRPGRGIMGLVLMINYRDIVTNMNSILAKQKRDALESFLLQTAKTVENYLLKKNDSKLVALLPRHKKNYEHEDSRFDCTLNFRFDYSRIIGKSPAMHKVYHLMEKVTNSSATILLQGKTGTGKELVANALHYNSERHNKPFVVQNCAALPENLLESELFGYKKGAFSGAVVDKKGLIEQADGGTLFLDEIGDMPLALQVKILRVLQDKIVRPLGSTNAAGRIINVRIIAATHCNLQKKIADGSFREDLFYRLSVFPIKLPTLQQRTGDIPELIQYFLEKMSHKHNKNIPGVSPDALSYLHQYTYPGNIRDLMNIIERSVLLTETGNYINEKDLPDEVTNCIGSASKNELTTKKMWSYVLQQHLSDNSNHNLKEIVAKFEAGIIKIKLEQCQWNQTRAANELNIARRTIIDKMSRYGIGKAYSTKISLEQNA